jgi:carbon-monoxide dehydrogenase small subunit
MSRLDFVVNREAASVVIEPRTSLADMLRDSLNLTGTHLGCEQGVCGACTIMVDNVPTRSCITNAMSCVGADIMTIEAFDDDALMSQLRDAFKAHHALQCGFCTPGMLIMARDMLLRLRDPTEDRIRIELSGNLCRCTGYAGIVKAIRSVAVAREQASISQQDVSTIPVGPAGAGHATSQGLTASSGNIRAAAMPPRAVSAQSRRMSAKARPKPSVRQSFVVDFPPVKVWERFGDVPAMIRCIPGAGLISSDPGGVYQIKMRVKMGPIAAEFVGIAEQQRDDSKMVGVISGSGRDAGSASLADGELVYRLAGEGESSTRIDIEVGYVLSGALGQFARGGIVNHFIGAITRQFAENLRKSLDAGPDAAGPELGSELHVFGSLLLAAKAWIAGLLTKLHR